jgi:hypothetical protein
MGKTQVTSLVRKIFKLLTTLFKLMNPILEDIKDIESNQINSDKERDIKGLTQYKSIRLKK